MRCARLRTAMCRLALAPVLVAALAQSAHALAQSAGDTTPHPGAMLVQVTDTSINPLPAEVVFPALGLGVRLSEEGTLLLVNVPDGVYVIQARHAGYVSDWRVIRVMRDTIRVDFVLGPSGGTRERGGWGAADESSLATARLLYFLSRRTSISVGSFLTRAEIERRRARTVSGLLRRVRDVRVDQMSSGWIALRSTEAAGPGCAGGMLVFVDALPLSAPGAPTGPPLAAAGDERAAQRARRTGWLVAARGAGRGTAHRAFRWVGPTARDLVPVVVDSSEAPEDASGQGQRANIDRVPLSSVVAVEVYPAPTGVPPEFRLPGAECGVVLIWTAGA